MEVVGSPLEGRRRAFWKAIGGFSRERSRQPAFWKHPQPICYSVFTDVSSAEQGDFPTGKRIHQLTSLTILVFLVSVILSLKRDTEPVKPIGILCVWAA